MTKKRQLKIIGGRCKSRICSICKLIWPWFCLNFSNIQLSYQASKMHQMKFSQFLFLLLYSFTIRRSNIKCQSQVLHFLNLCHSCHHFGKHLYCSKWKHSENEKKNNTKSSHQRECSEFIQWIHIHLQKMKKGNFILTCLVGSADRLTNELKY